MIRQAMDYLDNWKVRSNRKPIIIRGAKYPKTKPVRTSKSDYRKEDWMINLPLYAIHLLPEISE